MLDSSADCPQIAGCIITSNNGLADGVHKFGIPLRIETCAARACILWTRSVLTEESRAFLIALEPLHVLDGVTLCHGSVSDPDFYTTTPREALDSPVPDAIVQALTGKRVAIVGLPAPANYWQMTALFDLVLPKFTPAP